MKISGSNCLSNHNDLKEISNFRRALPQFLAVSVKNILLFAYGTTLGFPTIVIPALQDNGHNKDNNDIVLNTEETSWFSSINLICVPLGCLFSGILTQPIGKRRAMQLVNVPILSSWLLFHFATKTTHLYIALCLSGLGGGLMEAPVLTYVAEITEPKYRGILSALGSTCVITGIFVQYIMGSLLHWRTIAAISAIFPFVCIIALFFVPESPVWLIRKQNFIEGMKSLQWLRGWVSEKSVEDEFNQLYSELITQPAIEQATENAQADIKDQSACLKILRMFRKRSFIVPFLLVAYTFFTGHFSGKTSLQTYAVQIFHSLKAPINEYRATVLLGVADMIGTVLCVFLIHYTGKRPLVLISTIGVGFCLFTTATYAYYLNLGIGITNPINNNITLNSLSNDIQNNSGIGIDNETATFLAEYDLNDTTNVKSFFRETDNKTILTVDDQLIHKFPEEMESANVVWLPMILLLGSAFFAHMGIRMIPWILIGEVFPAAVRSTASGLVAGVGYIFGFLANKLFLQMLATLTLPGTFWLYSLVAFCGAIILYFTLPETEDRTLGEIEAHFSKKSSTNLLCKKQQKEFKKTHTQMSNFLESKSNQLHNFNHTTVSTAEGGFTNKAFHDSHITHL